MFGLASENRSSDKHKEKLDIFIYSKWKNKDQKQRKYHLLNH